MGCCRGPLLPDPLVQFHPRASARMIEHEDAVVLVAIGAAGIAFRVRRTTFGKWTKIQWVRSEILISNHQRPQNISIKFCRIGVSCRKIVAALYRGTVDK